MASLAICRSPRFLRGLFFFFEFECVTAFDPCCCLMLGAGGRLARCWEMELGVCVDWGRGGGLGSVAASSHTIPSSSTHPIHFLIHPHAEQMPNTHPTPTGQNLTEVDRSGQGEECGWGWNMWKGRIGDWSAALEIVVLVLGK